MTTPLTRRIKWHRHKAGSYWADLPDDHRVAVERISTNPPVWRTYLILSAAHAVPIGDTDGTLADAKRSLELAFD